MASEISNHREGSGYTRYSNEHQSFVYKYVLERFTELENRLKDAKKNVSISTDFLELIILITDSFTKLLSLSDQHESIKNLLNYLIPDRSKISAAENDNHSAPRISNNISYICDVCDESIIIVNQDLQFSIEHHNQSPHHKKTEELFRKVQTLSQRGRSTERNENKFQMNDSTRTVNKDDGMRNKIETSFTTPCQNNEANYQHRWTTDGNENTNEIASVILKDQETSTPAILSVRDNQNVNTTAPQFINHKETNLSLNKVTHHRCTACNLSFPSDSDFKSHLRSHRDRSKSYEQTNPNVSDTKEKTVYKLANSNVSEAKFEGVHANVPKAKKPIYECDIETVVEWDNSIRYCVSCNKLFGAVNTFTKHVESNDHIDNVEKLETRIRQMITLLEKRAETTPGMKGDKIRYCFVCDEILPMQHKCVYSFQANRRRSIINLARHVTHSYGTSGIRDLYAIPLVDQNGAHACKLCGIVFSGKPELLTHAHDVQHKSQIWQLKYFLDKTDGNAK